MFSKIKTYHIRTYGCQMNEYDSERIRFALESLEYQATKDPAGADIIIFNTCCVRQNADDKVYGRLGELKRLKQKKPSLIIIVCGCLAQKDKSELLKRFPYLNLVVGTFQINSLIELIKDVSLNHKQILKTDESPDHLDPEFPALRQSKVSALVPIIWGCDCKCTFCIVPYVRGPLKSRPIEDILAEVKTSLSNGYKEITLVGQNVTAYGQNLGNIKFLDLLQRINDIPQNFRLRFISPHPKDFDVDLIRGLGKLNKVCPHIHLPLQAGDDLILKQMKRGYTAKQFIELVNSLRKCFPGVAITTDIIVGFPTETEEQFKNTLKVVQEVQFDSAFMFAYSPRSGTPAVKIPETITREEKMVRLNKLIKIQNDITSKKNKALVGEIVEVLPESKSKKNPEFLAGHTPNLKNVAFPGTEDLMGKLVKVKIKKAYTWGLMGERE